MALLEERPGFIAFRLSGSNRILRQFQANEGGGYRFQRVPPTEKRGKVHTSTITVCCLAEPSKVEVRLNERDLEWSTCRGSGAGGQHRNTTDSAVKLKHTPSGIAVRVESERSQHQNKELARAHLRAKLLEAKSSEQNQKRSQKRRSQTLQSDRAEKRRTVRFQADEVVDISGKRMKAKLYMRGQIEDLWS